MDNNNFVQNSVEYETDIYKDQDPTLLEAKWKLRSISLEKQDIGKPPTKSKNLQIWYLANLYLRSINNGKNKK